MINLEHFTKYVELLTFRPDGTYDRNSAGFNLCTLTDEDLEYLKQQVTLSIQPLTDDDKIFFDNCTFPKLFVNDVPCKIKRVIKKDSATKIITNKENIISQKEVDQIKSEIVAKTETNYYIFDQDNINAYNIDLDRFLSNNNMQRLENIKSIPQSINKHRLLLVDDYGKLTTVENLVKYLNNYLPDPTDEQKETILSLLKSNEAENIDLGVNMCRMFKMDDILFDIYLALANIQGYSGHASANKANRNNVRWKYLMYFGKFTLYDFNDFYRPWSVGNRLVKIGSLYNSNVLSIKQKQKCWMYCYYMCGNFSYRNSHSLADALSIPENNRLTLTLNNQGQYYDLPERYVDIT